MYRAHNLVRASSLQLVDNNNTVNFIACTAHIPITWRPTYVFQISEHYFRISCCSLLIELSTQTIGNSVGNN